MKRACRVFCVAALFFLTAVSTRAYDQGYVYGCKILAVMTNPSPTAQDRFGNIGEVIGNSPRRFLVGASNDNYGAGCAYSYEYYNGALQSTITNPASVPGDHFGASLAAFGGTLSVGNILAAGAPDKTAGASNCGAIYFYEMTNGVLKMAVTNPTPTGGDRFGAALAGMSQQLLVGAPGDDTGATNAGCAYVYETNGVLSITVTNPAPAQDVYFGWAVAPVQGGGFVVGAPYADAGAAADAGVVYRYNSSGVLQQVITNPAPGIADHFGSVLRIVHDGFLVGVPEDDAGAIDAGSVYLYDGSGNLRLTVTNPAPSGADNFGAAVCSVEYTTFPSWFLIGSPGKDLGSATDAGAAYLFSTNGSLCFAVTNPVPVAGEQFGISVSQYAEGSRALLIGAQGAPQGSTNVGAAYQIKFYPFNRYREQYGFDTSTDDWAMPTNASMLGITNLVQSYAEIPDYGTEGANNLQMDCALTSGGARAEGRVQVNLQQYPPKAILAPVNLSNEWISINICFTNCTVIGTNRFRWFVTDDSARSQYGSWFEITNKFSRKGVSVMNVVQSNGTEDAGFDPSRIRFMGLQIVSTNANSALRGAAYMDMIQFPGTEAAFVAPTNQKYGFTASAENWSVGTWDKAMTNCFWVASAPSNSTGCLGIDVDLGTAANWDKGEVSVSMEYFAPTNVTYPVNLDGRKVTAWVYCPVGALGTGGYNTVSMFCKDADAAWRSFYGSEEHIVEGVWFPVSMTPSSNSTPHYGYKDAGFDSFHVRAIGLKIGRGSGSYGGNFRGTIFLDGVSFSGTNEPIAIRTNDLRYSFEPNREGWSHETYTGITGVVAVSQSSAFRAEGTNSLRLDMNIRNTGTNRSQGAAKVDMRWYPPATVRTPFNLAGVEVRGYLYCPAGAASTNPLDPNTARVYVNDGSWNSQYGSASVMRNDQWIEMTVVPTTNGGFQATNIIAMGVDINMNGVYTNALYLDAVAFHADAPAAITNSQHGYDFETACQLEWWKWGPNADGWHAKAWTNTYYETNAGSAGSVALAADGTFALGVNEVVTNNGVVTTNLDVMRKAVFEIAYQPALNLSTKDHRRIQAKMMFVPAIEGLLSFDASLNIYDKITDQWYKKDFKVGGLGWNILEFNLDDPADYSTNNAPAGPMNASAIGFINIQLYANAGWTGTVYVDDIVVGGRETGTNFNRVATGFVRPAGHKFVLDGTNFYFCGANIEYLQTESDAVVQECLDWAASNHLQAVRTWSMQEGKPYSFQPQRGVWNELMFEHMDRVIAMAGHRNIRLMLGLCDNWAHNGGMFQYVAWAVREHPESVDTNLNKEGVLYHDQFWTNQWCRQWYRDYVGRLLRRTNTITGVVYKDDPTIMGFEIVNEPRCESDFTGKTVHDWLNAMSDWVRTIDTNHMLGNGEEGGYINTYDFADTIPWEVYPDNYYHYATYATGTTNCDLYGCGRGHGVDFISDGKSASTWVTWQGGFYTNRDAPQGEWRAGNSNINFCTARIYVDQKEYNVWRTNQNSSDQRIEWLNDHWYDAHETVGKPMILDEFGIHAIGWIFNGSYGQVQLVRTPSYTLTDRVDIYALYYRYIQNSGVSGSFFWNFGFEGMWEDPFHTCEAVYPWYPNTGEGSATGVSLSTSYVLAGSNSLRLSWNVVSADSNKAIYVCPTNAMWVLRVDNSSTNEPPTIGVNRVKFFWNIYNPGGTNLSVALGLRGTTSTWIWAESVTNTLTGGWNRVMFDLSAGDWAWAGSGWQHNEYLIHMTNNTGTNVLEDVREVDLVFYGLTNGPGCAYIDDITIKRDDGFVVYADDPVNPTIKAHADWMAARNVATNAAGNHAPIASNRTIVADAFRATNVTLLATDEDGDPLSYRIITRPTNGWVFGIPPTNVLYKSRPGTSGGDLFSFKANDGKADSVEAVITVNVGSTDTDGDSLPDAWEFTYFPKRVQYWPYDSDNLTNMFGLGDWDMDGYSDFDEYKAGTDPTNTSSYLYVTSLSNANTGTFYVRWPSVSGKQYQMQRSTNLVVGPFSNLSSHITAAPPMNTYTDAASGAGPFLYRVRVE